MSSFLNNINWRYATKSFNKEKKISEENLQKIRESIRLAPSSFGLQMFKVLEVTDLALREKLKEVSWNQSQVVDSDRLFIFLKRSDAENRIEEMFNDMSGGDMNIRNTNLKAYEDMIRNFTNSKTKEDIFEWSSKQDYIALGFAMAACAELNIDSCPMEGFDENAVKSILNLSDEFRPVVYLAVGYRDESDKNSIRPKWRFLEEKVIEKI